jgi:hypothetical protein
MYRVGKDMVRTSVGKSAFSGGRYFRIWKYRCARKTQEMPKEGRKAKRKTEKLKKLERGKS